ncbi:MAG TPA: dephospho-CoA kinase [Anaerolineaceae bacterium]|nr:dephospho-CoA kinase [Anaerolineaceae bacterium]
MSKWPGKYVIGLTGNIATGKSVVRRMLEHLGAYGIDADALANRAIARGAPGYKPVVEMFGRWILGQDLQIDRSKLARIVFSDPQALAILEAIVHPLVFQAIDIIVQRSTQPVVVIEAIKILETDIHKQCDSLWVSYAPPEVQLTRLRLNRNMGDNEARQRILSQPRQEQKLARANVVIRNTGTFEDTWRQVLAAWQTIFPAGETAIPEEKPTVRGQLSVQRGRPRHSAEIAELINRVNANQSKVGQDEIMAAFGEKAFMLLHEGEPLVGVLGWQVENLVSRTTDVYLDAKIPVQEALPALLNEVERASRDLQCEASLVLVTPEIAQKQAIWKELGYEERTPQSLKVQAWQEAAHECQTPGMVLLFKQLRTDRVLRPI